jgi:WD40 repeat protein
MHQPPAHRTGRRIWVVALVTFAAPSVGTANAAKSAPWSHVQWGEAGLLTSADDKETGITALAASADGTLLATGYADGSVRVWNAATTIERFALRGHQGEVFALTITGGGRTLVSATAAEVIRWDAGSGARRKTVTLQVGPIEHAVLTPDGRTLLAATPGDHVLLVDSTTGAERARLERPARPVLALAVSPDGKMVACAEEGGAVSVWSLPSGRAEVILAPEKDHLPRALAFSPDGRRIAVCLGRDGVTVWDRATKERRAHLRPETLSACAVAFAGDGRGVAVGTPGGSLVACDLTAGRRGRSVHGHAGQVQRMLFLPGNRLVTASADATVRLWRAYVPGQPEPAVPEPELSEREAATVLGNLAAANTDRAERAARAMLLVPRQSVALLRKHLKPVVPADPKRFAQVWADLDSPRYTVRRKAFEALQQLGESAKDLIRQALASPSGLETHQRLRLLLARLENPASAEDLRQGLRAVEVLGRINSPQARRFLEELAQGVQSAHLTRAAQVALGRRQ